MIGIRINNQFAEVDPGTRVNIELNNPLFNEDNLSPGSISYPFDIPDGDTSPLNAQLLGHPDVLEATGGFRKIDADLYLGDVPFKTGKLLIRGRGKRATTNFNFGLSTLSDEFKTKKLRDIVAQEVVISTASVQKKIFLKARNIVDYPTSASFPSTGNENYTYVDVTNEEAYGWNGSAYYVIVGVTTPFKIIVNSRNYEAWSLSDLVDEINGDNQEPRAQATYFGSGSTPRGLAAPYIQLANYNDPNDVLADLSVGYQQEFYGNWLVESSDLTAYFAEYDTFLKQASTSIRFPFCFNNLPYGDEGGTNITKALSGNYVNACRLGTYRLQFNEPNYGLDVGVPWSVLNMTSFQPFLRLRWVLDKIAEYFGFEYEGDWHDTTDVNNALIDNTYLLDNPMPYIGLTKFVFFDKGFNYKDLVPDISVRDFLRLLQDHFNLGIYRNERTNKVRIIQREPVAKRNATKDITAKCGAILGNDDVRVTGYRIYSEKVEADGLSVVKEFISGDAEVEFKSGISPLKNQLYNKISYYQNGIKSYSTPGFIGAVKTQKMRSSFGLRLLYDLGELTNGITYRGGSANASTYNENWSGANNLHDKFWKYWLLFVKNRRVVTLPANLIVRDLQELDWEEKVFFDRKPFMIKKISIPVSTVRIEECEVELYSML